MGVVGGGWGWRGENRSPLNKNSQSSLQINIIHVCKFIDNYYNSLCPSSSCDAWLNNFKINILHKVITYEFTCNYQNAWSYHANLYTLYMSTCTFTNIAIMYVMTDHPLYRNWSRHTQHPTQEMWQLKQSKLRDFVIVTLASCWQSSVSDTGPMCHWKLFFF